jgi:hypothetical protein
MDNVGGVFVVLMAGMGLGRRNSSLITVPSTSFTCKRTADAFSKSFTLSTGGLLY